MTLVAADGMWMRLVVCQTQGPSQSISSSSLIAARRVPSEARAIDATIVLFPGRGSCDIASTSPNNTNASIPCDRRKRYGLVLELIIFVSCVGVARLQASVRQAAIAIVSNGSTYRSAQVFSEPSILKGGEISIPSRTTMYASAPGVLSQVSSARPWAETAGELPPEFSRSRAQKNCVGPCGTYAV